MTAEPRPVADLPSQGSGAKLPAVERFIREVLPQIALAPPSASFQGHKSLIGDAAADRGLSAKTIGGTIYFYDGGMPVGGMTKWTPTLVGSRALAVCKSKDLTKQMLAAAGLPTPAGIALRPDQLGEGLAHVRASDRPMVLKPSTGKGGAGITCGITCEQELRAAWEVARQAAENGSVFVLEEQIDGVDIRAYVVGSRVAAAATRVNFHVIGDGRSSIVELIKQKRHERDQHRHLVKEPQTVDAALLARSGRTLHDVPPAKEIVVLNSVSNLHVGGWNVDVTDIAHPDLLDLAVETTRAIPGLGVVGVDLLAPDIGTAEGAVILEVNHQPGMGVHRYPAYGTPRDVAGAIIDEMITTARSLAWRPPTKADRAGHAVRAARRRPLRRGSSSWKPAPAVERFVRDVLPVLPPRQVPSVRNHVPLIKRAAKDRGLVARNDGDWTYFYDGRQAVGGVHKQRMTTLHGQQAIAVCDSKDLTKQMLMASGLPTPTGVALGPDQFDEALSHLRSVGSAVLKPSFGMRGRGVTCGIETEEDLRAAWEIAGRAVRRQPPRFMLEKLIVGVDIRAFVVGRRVVASCVRLPAHVVGDGRRSIAELLELKQRQRLANPYLAHWPSLSVDATMLARAGRTLHDVPASGDVIVLNRVANLHHGGENIDVTDLVHPDLQRLAVDATRAVPGLRVAGVDLMAPDLDSVDGAVILELNAGAAIRLHYHSAYGKPRDVAGAIVDEMLATAGAPARPVWRTRAVRRVARFARGRLPTR